MTSMIDDEELSLSISTTSSRREPVRPPPKPAPRTAERKAPEVAPKVRFGQYDVVKTLGEGSFGKVKLATHQKTGQKVALKIINRKKLKTRDMAGRIEREIQYLQLLRHPHIIKLFHVITTATEIIMVLEYAGTELFDYIVNHGKLGEDRGRRFFQQIVCAVEYCHRHKIVHRDLKPENLLLDESLNVKIADFGLSNIMTDGNFLKTSCGSPNYAAPEVISGKLYAGPEVDVWSCGVILYVLLVGRLPFDDEYIPTLFKKIAAGQFYIPAYLSPGAARLIKKMLVVSPVQRITIADIRQDPWFNVDLAPYLQLPIEDFIPTSTDSTQPAVKLHQAVVEKLEKTIGYAKEDVQEALSKDEPSTIKDAYNIVRENQIMNPLFAQEQNLVPFLAQSPPAQGNQYLNAANFPRPPTAGRDGQRRPADQRKPTGQKPSDQKPTEQRPVEQKPAEPMAPVAQIMTQEPRAVVSTTSTTIAVLASSMPEFHKAYMEGRPQSSSAVPSDVHIPPVDGTTQSPEQQAITARALKPHSRSQIGLDGMTKPERLTPMPSKKTRPTRWQFGIRSRNSPAEAMLALYKALQVLKADWEVPRLRRHRSHSGSGRSGSDSEDDDDDGPRQWADEEGDVDQNHHRRSRSASGDEHGRPIPSGNRGRVRGRRSDYGAQNDWGYNVPVDPWVIRARFEKGGLYPPGAAQSNSAHSSRVDLTAVDEELRRKQAAEPEGTATDNASFSGPASGHVERNGAGPTKAARAAKDPDEKLYVYLNIQLYTIEKDFYLVDFKCAGYERLDRELVKEVLLNPTSMDGRSSNNNNSPAVGASDGGPLEWRSLADMDEAEAERVAAAAAGRGEPLSVRVREVLVGQPSKPSGEKDVTSPFPFMEIASRLVAALAQEHPGR